MLKFFLLGLLLLPCYCFALADEYLLQQDSATAGTRSQQECARRGCDGKFTVYWWSVIKNPITSAGAVVIQPGTPYDTTGLTPEDKIQADATKTLTPDWFTTDPISGQPVLTPVDPKTVIIVTPALVIVK